MFDWFEMSPVEQETLLPRDSISAASSVSAEGKGEVIDIMGNDQEKRTARKSFATQRREHHSRNPIPEMPD